jgi:hypothetical protein
MNALTAAGLWIARKADGSGWQIGPKALMDQHPDLVAEARAQKTGLCALIESHPATALFTLPDDPAHGETEACAACGQTVYVIAGDNGQGKRLGAHRLPDGRTVCTKSLVPVKPPVPQAVALLERFIAERCEPRPQALLTWYGFRGALMGYCLRHHLTMPQEDEIRAYMLAHYPLPPGIRKHQGEAFAGLVMKVSEWLGDDKEEP